MSSDPLFPGLRISTGPDDPRLHDVDADFTALLRKLRGTCDRASASGVRPTSTVCVVGAGPSGLTVAHELEHLGHTVVVLEREPVVGGKSVSVDVDGRAYDLGAHICTPRYEELAELAAADERDIAARIRTIDYYTVLCRISGLPRGGMYLVRSEGEAPPPGHCVAYRNRYSDTNVYTCYSYGAQGLETADIVRQLRDDVAQACFVRPVLVAHFLSGTTRDGIPARW
ncbi:FAD-dependent oxidoreductase [Saccharopolyspora shandongensis]|uniref:FAD-dependent oxidoreductase n=1 Tax=Saccharopolyspora shandongensis TaxID=418495 RepID=UPI003429AE94